MFAKKFLSIIALLFVGNKFVNAVTAPTISACTDISAGFTGIGESCGDTSGDITTYCYHNKVIYGFTATNAGTLSDCKVKSGSLDSGVHILKVDTTIADANISTTTGTTTDLEKIAIYNCNTNGCERAYGYIKDDEDAYYSIGATANESVTGEASCDGKLGLLNSSKEICLLYDTTDAAHPVTKSAPVTTSGTAYYLLDGTPDATNPFTGSATSTSIAIQVGTNYMIYDKFYSSDTNYEYCVDASKKIDKRGDNWCNSEDCSYYKCETGTCTEVSKKSTGTACDPTAPSNCSDGYYLYNAGLVTSNNGSGTLYLCSSGGTDCKIVGTGSGQTGTKIPVGYLINADSENFTTVPFLKCTSLGACTAISATTASDCSSNSIGDLIETTASTVTTYSLCLAASSTGGITLATYDTTGPTLTPIDGKKYFISVANANANVFGDVSDANYIYAGINLTSGSITLNESQESGVRYKYTDASFEIKDRGSSDICEGTPKTAKAGTKEFKKSDSGSVDYYMDNTANISPA